MISNDVMRKIIIFILAKIIVFEKVTRKKLVAFLAKRIVAHKLRKKRREEKHKDERIRRRKQEQYKDFFLVPSLISVALIVLGVAVLLLYEINIKHSKELYAQTTARFTVLGTPREELPEETYDDDAPEEKNDWVNDITVDLDAISAEYPDVIGWIFFENEDISYPIVYSGDDETYLRRDYEGNVSRAGSIFMEGLNSPDFSDVHTILYGHNMRDLTMFGKLKYYMWDSEYYKTHRYIQIITRDEEGKQIKYRYRLFAYEPTAAISPVYTVCRNGDSAFYETMQYIQGNSKISDDNFITDDSHILTLSTCSADDTRLIVSFIRIQQH